MDRNEWREGIGVGGGNGCEYVGVGGKDGGEGEEGGGEKGWREGR